MSYFQKKEGRQEREGHAPESKLYGHNSRFTHLILNENYENRENANKRTSFQEQAKIDNNSTYSDHTRLQTFLHTSSKLPSLKNTFCTCREPNWKVAYPTPNIG